MAASRNSRNDAGSSASSRDRGLGVGDWVDEGGSEISDGWSIAGRLEEAGGNGASSLLLLSPSGFGSGRGGYSRAGQSSGEIAQEWARAGGAARDDCGDDREARHGCRPL